MGKLLIALFLFPLLIVAQNDTINKVIYSNDYQFKEGIYINYEQVILNKPLDKIRLITSLKPDDDEFYEELLKSDKISFFDDYGINQEIPTEKIWGYCKNNSLYINYRKESSKIILIGSVCHFTAITKVYHERYNDSFYGYGSMGFTPYQTNELREYLFDFKTGRILDLSIESLDVILKRNTALNDEFNKLKKRKKRQLMYYFLRKYNESEPLYLAKP
jgi:hypothetical protein